MEVTDLLGLEADIRIPNHYYERNEEEIVARIQAIKERMGDRLFIPGHHYQKDEVIQFADARGDSLKLAQICAEMPNAEFIVFCGVHFMAETADMLTKEHQQVILPDMRAGCSMADMADIEQTERGWERMQKIWGDTILPLTYVNSTAAIKGFVGKYGGACVTSGNVKKMLRWAFDQKERILFLPDQHLGRNTAFELGVPLEHMCVYDPISNDFEYEGAWEDVRVILWKGHCSVHEKFTVEHVKHAKLRDPEIQVIVHPECPFDVVQASDFAGSTNYIIDTITQAEAGSKWAIGTEMNLVNRIIAEHPDKQIESLNPFLCPCLTMNRIDLPHLLWSLEELEAGRVVNRITVEPSVAQNAVLSLERMLELS